MSSSTRPRAVGRVGTDDEFRPQFAQRFAQLRAELRLIFGYNDGGQAHVLKPPAITSA
jgi:hypothetical protein